MKTKLTESTVVKSWFLRLSLGLSLGLEDSQSTPEAKWSLYLYVGVANC